MDTFFSDYVKWQEIVSQYPVTAENYYLALGLADEWGEVCSANSLDDIKKELGDFCWYLFRYYNRVLNGDISITLAAIEIDLESIKVESSKTAITYGIGIICGIEKKRLRDRLLWTVSKREEKTAAAYMATRTIIANVMKICTFFGTDLTEILQINQNKLSNRLASNTIRGDGDNR